MSRLTLSVVIPVRDGGQDFLRCLEGVRGQTEAAHELIVIDDGSRDGSAAAAEAAGAVVLRQAAPQGPARARNEGTRRASGDVLVFIDADVVMHADTLARLRQCFEQDTELTAVSGRYDDAPAAPGLVSRYRNLLHGYTHLRADGDAGTFWTGCGAVRRAAFQAVGGFDPRFGTYPPYALEDVELGMRLAKAGNRLAIRGDVQVKHLKRWRFWPMVKTDVWQRAVPWMQLLLEAREAPASLNLRWSQRVSVAAALAAVPAAVLLWPWGGMTAAAAHAGLNWRFLRYLGRTQGWWFALRAWPLHLVHHFYSGMAVPLGLGAYAWRRLFRQAAEVPELQP